MISDKKPGHLLRSLVAVVLVIAVLAGVGAFSSLGGDKSATVASSIAATHSWTVLLNVTGASSKNTDTFTIAGDRLKVDWNLVPQKIGGQDAPYLLGVLLVPEGQEKGDSLVDVSSSATHSDTTFVNVHPGRYYLKIITANLDNYQTVISQ